MFSKNGHQNIGKLVEIHNVAQVDKKKNDALKCVPRYCLLKIDQVCRLHLDLLIHTYSSPEYVNKGSNLP